MDQLALLKDQTAKTRQCRRKSPKPTPSSAKSRRITKAGKKAGKNLVSGDGWRFYCKSSENMEEIDSDSVALTITSPPYWDAIDYDLHADKGNDVWYRQRAYDKCGATYEQWLLQMSAIFKEVHRVTMDGGFCAVVLGTILKNKKHFPAPFDFTA